MPSSETDKYMVVLYKKDGAFFRRIGECPISNKGVSDFLEYERKHQAEMELLRVRISELEEKYETIPEPKYLSKWPFPAYKTSNRQIEGLDAALCGQSRSNAELAGTGDKR